MPSREVIDRCFAVIAEDSSVDASIDRVNKILIAQGESRLSLADSFHYLIAAISPIDFAEDDPLNQQYDFDVAAEAITAAGKITQQERESITQKIQLERNLARKRISDEVIFLRNQHLLAFLSKADSRKFLQYRNGNGKKILDIVIGKLPLYSKEVALLIIENTDLRVEADAKFTFAPEDIARAASARVADFVAPSPSSLPSFSPLARSPLPILDVSALDSFVMEATYSSEDCPHSKEIALALINKGYRLQVSNARILTKLLTRRNIENGVTVFLCLNYPQELAFELILEILKHAQKQQNDFIARSLMPARSLAVAVSRGVSGVSSRSSSRGAVEDNFDFKAISAMLAELLNHLLESGVINVLANLETGETIPMMLLIEHLKSKASGGRTILAALWQNLQAIDRFRKLNAGLLRVCGNMGSLLHYVVADNNMALLDATFAIIDRDAPEDEAFFINVNFANEMPLHVACRLGLDDFIFKLYAKAPRAFLSKCKVFDVDGQEVAQDSCLCLVARSGMANSARLLLRIAGHQITQEMIVESCMVAIDTSHEGVVKVLMAYNFDSRQEIKNQLLAAAVEKGNFTITMMALKYGADLLPTFRPPFSEKQEDLLLECKEASTRFHRIVRSYRKKVSTMGFSEDDMKLNKWCVAIFNSLLPIFCEQFFQCHDDGAQELMSCNVVYQELIALSAMISNVAAKISLARLPDLSLYSASADVDAINRDSLELLLSSVSADVKDLILKGEIRAANTAILNPPSPSSPRAVLAAGSAAAASAASTAVATPATYRAN